MSELAFIHRLLQVTADADLCGEIRWTVRENRVQFWVNCGDVFEWGTADCEEITPANLSLLEQSVADARLACRSGTIWADSLFCARVRQQRPQDACYKSYPKELWPLFDACGPQRQHDFLNPGKRPDPVAM